ncbi:MAG: DUF3179 domain-containing (seleno)protein [Halobacteriales archaeon]
MGIDRRRLLALVGTGVTAVAGCTRGSTVGSTDPPVDSTTPEPLAKHGVPSTICAEDPAANPGIPAIVEPAFARDWAAITVPERYRSDPSVDGLTPEQTVIGLVIDGQARAYPLEVLYYHEIVNDRIDTATTDRSILVSFCPLCNSGMVADRTIDGTPTEFIVSGLLWKPPRLEQSASVVANRTFGAGRRNGSTAVSHSGNLVMIDRATGSYWSQILAQAICGPLRGRQLSIIPSTVTTWQDWQATAPETEVLLPPPHSRHVAGN